MSFCISLKSLGKEHLRVRYEVTASRWKKNPCRRWSIFLF